MNSIMRVTSLCLSLLVVALCSIRVQGISVEAQRVRTRLQALRHTESDEVESAQEAQRGIVSAEALALGEKVCIRIGKGSEDVYTNKQGGKTHFTPLVTGSKTVDVKAKFAAQGQQNTDGVTAFDFHVAKVKKLNCRINIFTKHSHMGSLGLPIAGRKGLWTKFLKKFNKASRKLTNKEAATYTTDSVQLKAKRSRLYEQAKNIPHNGILILGQCNPDYFHELKGDLKVDEAKAAAKIAQLEATIDPADPERAHIVRVCNKVAKTTRLGETMTMVAYANWHYNANPADQAKWKTKTIYPQGENGCNHIGAGDFQCKGYSLALLKKIDAFQMDPATFTPDTY